MHTELEAVWVMCCKGCCLRMKIPNASCLLSLDMHQVLLTNICCNAAIQVWSPKVNTEDKDLSLALHHSSVPECLSAEMSGWN